MTIRRCAGHSGADGESLRCFDETGRPQSLAVSDDDTGSLLMTSSSPSGKTEQENDAKLCSPSSFVVVEQRLRPLIFVIFSLLPSLAIVVAFSSWTFTSVQVQLEAIVVKFELYFWLALYEL